MKMKVSFVHFQFPSLQHRTQQTEGILKIAVIPSRQSPSKSITIELLDSIQRQLTALPDGARVTQHRRQNVLSQHLPGGCLWQFFKSVKEDTSSPSSFSHHLSSSPLVEALAPTDVKNRNTKLLAVPCCVVIFYRANSQIWKKESISRN